MKYDTAIDFELKKAQIDFKALCDAKKKITLSSTKKKRSVTQNAYLHVCVGLYGIYFGSTLDEAKTDLKRACQFMVYEKNNKKYLKRTREMDSKQLTEFIEWIRNYAGTNGCYIPTSEEYIQNHFAIDKEIEANKKYL